MVGDSQRNEDKEWQHAKPRESFPAEFLLVNGAR
jgi:hypothetical protein